MSTRLWTHRAFPHSVRSGKETDVNHSSGHPQATYHGLSSPRDISTRNLRLLLQEVCPHNSLRCTEGRQRPRNHLNAHCQENGETHCGKFTY